MHIYGLICLYWYAHNNSHCNGVYIPLQISVNSGPSVWRYSGLCTTRRFGVCSLGECHHNQVPPNACTRHLSQARKHSHTCSHTIHITASNLINIHEERNLSAKIQANCWCHWATAALVVTEQKTSVLNIDLSQAFPLSNLKGLVDFIPLSCQCLPRQTVWRAVGMYSSSASTSTGVQKVCEVEAYHFLLFRTKNGHTNAFFLVGDSFSHVYLGRK